MKGTGGGAGRSSQRKRRERDGDDGGEGNEGRKGQKNRGQRGVLVGDPFRVSGVCGGELPGPRLGDGPRWDLRGADAAREEVTREEVDKELEGHADLIKMRRYIEQLERENRSMRKGSDARCSKMLGHALSGSEDGTDVVFVFGDGHGKVCGHREMLCAGSEAFAGMFRSGMVEEQEGKINIPSPIGTAALRGLLEWVYLGRAGEECAKADGRELWVLGEMYEVAGLREWLVEEKIHMDTLRAAYEFALVPEGVERGPVIERCNKVMQQRGWAVDEAFLEGLSKGVVREIVLAQSKHRGVERLGWRNVRAGFRLLEKWLKANGGACAGGDVSAFFEIAEELDLLAIPLKALRDMLGFWEMANPVWASGLCERKEAAGGNNFEVEYAVERRHKVADADIQCAHSVGTHGEGSEQRIAFSDFEKKQVRIVNLESGKIVATVGSKGRGPGQFEGPAGVAYSSKGDLYVSDKGLNRIEVFDRQGRYVRRIGERGQGPGQFKIPLGICFTNQNNLLVVDGGNHRVQVFREDGTFVRAFGTQGKGEGELQHPTAICAGRNGNIIISDSFWKRVQMFDGEGRFIRSIGSEGDGPGQFKRATGIAVGEAGEIIVSDCEREDIQVFSKEGELLQIIGKGGDSDVVWGSNASPLAVCTSGDGRLVALTCDTTDTDPQKSEIVVLS